MTKLGIAVTIVIVLIGLAGSSVIYTMGRNHALREVRHDLYFAFRDSSDTEYYLVPDEPDAVPGNLRGNDTAVGRCFTPHAEELLTRWLPGTEWQ